jgi:hypothetical protein
VVVCLAGAAAGAVVPVCANIAVAKMSATAVNIIFFIV